MASSSQDPPTFENPPDYVGEALILLKERADAEGLIVDTDGTAAVRSLLGNAIAEARKEEGAEAFSPSRQKEFAKAAQVLAEEATGAAHEQNALYVNQSHIERAITKLSSLKIWPFTKGSRRIPNG